MPNGALAGGFEVRDCRMYLCSSDPELACVIPTELRGVKHARKEVKKKMKGEVQLSDVSNNSKRLTVAQGFLDAYMSVHAQVEDVVRSQFASGGRNFDLLITGHSLGGALARLCAYHLLTGPHASMLSEKTWLCTMGAAAPGDAKFAGALDLLLSHKNDPWRSLHVVHQYDIVPYAGLSVAEGGSVLMYLLQSLLPSGFVRTHPGRLIYFPKNGCGARLRGPSWRYIFLRGAYPRKAAMDHSTKSHTSACNGL